MRVRAQGYECHGQSTFGIPSLCKVTPVSLPVDLGQGARGVLRSATDAEEVVTSGSGCESESWSGVK